MWIAPGSHDCHEVRTAPTSGAQLGLRMGVGAAVGLFSGAAAFFVIKQRAEDAEKTTASSAYLSEAVGFGFLVGTAAGLLAHLVVLGATWATRTAPVPLVAGPPAKASSAAPPPPPRAPPSSLRKARLPPLPDVCVPWIGRTTPGTVEGGSRSSLL